MMVRRGRHLGGLGLGLALCAALTARAPGQTRQLAVDALVERTIQYVDRYREQLRFLLADEVTEQRARQGDMVRERTTRGELFVTWLPAERRWVAVHDVAEVDGVPVPDREQLSQLLLASPVEAVARAVLARNARFNLGGVVRNFNEPTLALQMFHRERRDSIRYRRGSTATVAGVPLVQLAFEERERPTLIQSARGAPVYARGDVWIEAETGLIRSTRIQLRDDPVRAELSSTFAEDDRLGLWVPVVFTERYVAFRGGQGEIIDASSHYTNYRRFEASARIK